MQRSLIADRGIRGLQAEIPLVREHRVQGGIADATTIDHRLEDNQEGRWLRVRLSWLTAVQLGDLLMTSIASLAEA
jgi:hypothetical protein